MELTLKRGSGLGFDGENWQLAKDARWEKCPQIVPHANRAEKFVGTRELFGVEHAVFLMLNDEYFAQPVSICKMPIPDDPMEIVYDAYMGKGEEEQPAPTKKSTAGKTQFSKALVFKGANWKLVKDNKWKSVSGFVPTGLGDPVGTKTIGSKTYNIYKSSLGFVAIGEEHAR